MNYLYHRVPEIVKGDLLLPQNVLKKKHPKLYKKAMKKYRGRENINKARIPTLNCTWSDVLFLSPIEPIKIAKALKKAGRKSTIKMKFYKINPYKLDKKKTAVYLYKYDTILEEGKKDNFTSFDPKNLSKYNRVPSRTVKYYKKIIKLGRNPLMYHFIPHILYRDELSVKGVKTVEVNI